MSLLSPLLSRLRGWEDERPWERGCSDQTERLKLPSAEFCESTSSLWLIYLAKSNNSTDDAESPFLSRTNQKHRHCPFKSVKTAPQINESETCVLLTVPFGERVTPDTRLDSEPALI